MNPEFIRTICPYCGTGCGLVLKVEEGRAAATYPDRENPVSRGSLCVKGWVAHEFVHHPERLTSPLLRKGDRFEEISWEEAIELAAAKLKETAAKYGPDSVGGLSSAKCTNEENYLFQKLIRAAFKTNNVDHCARLCHAATTVGMLQTLGSGAMTNSISDLAGADCILFIGSNAAESHPVLMGEVYKALDRGAKIIVIDPRETPVARNAHKLLRLNPGTDIPLLAGMMRHIVDKGLHKTGFIEKRTENFETLKTFLQAWPVEKAAKETGIDEAVIREVAETYARAENAAIVYCMGITQHACGAANVIAVVDLAMLCGHVGKPFSGIYPLRGQNNVQGACDMGALPNLYPGYQAVADAGHPGEIPEGLEGGALRQAGAHGDGAHQRRGKGHPRPLHHGREPLCERPRREPRHGGPPEARLPHRPGHLPDGNGEIRPPHTARRLLCREDGDLHEHGAPLPAAAQGRGAAREGDGRLRDPLPDGQGPGACLSTTPRLPRSCRSIANLVPAYAGICFDRLERAGLQWPCPDENHPGTRFLHGEKFTRGLGRFVIPDYTPPMEKPDAEYPYYLNTGRVFAHYHTGTMTRRSPFLNREIEDPYVEIHPDDATRILASEPATGSGSPPDGEASSRRPGSRIAL